MGTSDFLASRSKAQETIWTCDWHLKQKQSSEAEPSACEIWYYLWVGSVRIELLVQWRGKKNYIRIGTRVTLPLLGSHPHGLYQALTAPLDTKRGF